MKEGLTIKNKLAYGSGDFGLAFTSSMLSLLFAIFLTDVVMTESNQLPGRPFILANKRKRYP